MKNTLLLKRQEEFLSGKNVISKLELALTLELNTPIHTGKRAWKLQRTQGVTGQFYFSND